MGNEQLHLAAVGLGVDPTTEKRARALLIAVVKRAITKEGFEAVERQVEAGRLHYVTEAAFFDLFEYGLMGEGGVRDALTARGIQLAGEYLAKERAERARVERGVPISEYSPGAGKISAEWLVDEVDSAKAYSNGGFILKGDAPSAARKERQVKFDAVWSSDSNTRPTQPVAYAAPHGEGQIWFSAGVMISARFYDHILSRYPGAQFSFPQERSPKSVLHIYDSGERVGIIQPAGEDAEMPEGVKALLEASRGEARVDDSRLPHKLERRRKTSKRPENDGGYSPSIRRILLNADLEEGRVRVKEYGLAFGRQPSATDRIILAEMHGLHLLESDRRTLSGFGREQAAALIKERDEKLKRLADGVALRERKTGNGKLLCDWQPTELDGGAGFTNGHLLVKGEMPPGTVEPERFERGAFFWELAVSVPQEEIRPVAYTDHGGVQKLIWFSNKQAVNPDYYDFFVRRFPDLTFTAAFSGRKCDNQIEGMERVKDAINVYSKGVRRGVLLPVREPIGEAKNCWNARKTAFLPPLPAGVARLIEEAGTHTQSAP